MLAPKTQSPFAGSRKTNPPLHYKQASSPAHDHTSHRQPRRHPRHKHRKDKKSSDVKSGSPGYMDQDPRRGHEASPQSGLGVGCELYSSSKNLRGLSVRAHERHKSISLSFSVAGVFSFLSPPRSAMRRGAWKCNAGSP